MNSVELMGNNTRGIPSTSLKCEVEAPASSNSYTFSEGMGLLYSIITINTLPRQGLKMMNHCFHAGWNDKEIISHNAAKGSGNGQLSICNGMRD